MEKPVISEEQMDNLCYSSYQLLQAMSNAYGSDPAYELFLKIEEVLGPEVKSNLFLKMLDSTFTGVGILHFHFPNNQCTNVITMIKAAREYAVNENRVKLSLNEAKDIIDSARSHGKGTLHFLSHESRKLFINELKANNGVQL